MGVKFGLSQWKAATPIFAKIGRYATATAMGFFSSGVKMPKEFSIADWFNFIQSGLWIVAPLLVWDFFGRKQKTLNDIADERNERIH